MDSRDDYSKKKKREGGRVGGRERDIKTPSTETQFKIKYWNI